MVSVLGLVGLLLIVVVQTAIAALLTRLFRVRLKTRWGSLLYALLVTPIVLTLTTLLLSGVIGLGADLGSRRTAIFVTIFVPLALGLTIDYVWMPTPEEVELPASTE